MQQKTHHYKHLRRNSGSSIKHTGEENSLRTIFTASFLFLDHFIVWIGQDKHFSLGKVKDVIVASPQKFLTPLTFDTSSCSSFFSSLFSSFSSYSPPISLFSSSSSSLSMHTAASLNVHLDFLLLPRQNIPPCFRSLFGFRAPAVLNGVNEVNGHRMRNGGGRGKELQGTLRSSARFMTPPRSEERGVQIQMEEAKKADFRSKLSFEQRIGR
ncbi:uncharacterized protein MONOS_11158 [Monocercomonoides exilis]|uniref:uncharacterized protein n=1 Tax=Monocercomonoides exilis TaxID=2049356 RepID=UPI00355A704C|nr:hypothetical protein MONOS_11158 [Monocercomonoides exilis]|eukprot:MONOS_11158.1-p1 / transcript=MONOS_11158.1 / gene=MONOS_11158 / organism=Monocercomonoides_exilis_PA203 / gene_product=unspecified product / transcript_product=unspecified product / location=Mono_scaffold00545:20911-21546(-) / protein_length=212 / sequence_SO=supercontig / SO=protein_coding / is_pseudo=false